MRFLLVAVVRFPSLAIARADEPEQVKGKGAIVFATPIALRRGTACRLKSSSYSRRCGGVFCVIFRDIDRLLILLYFKESHGPQIWDHITEPETKVNTLSNYGFVTV